MDRPYTIGTLARAAGVNVETIRYYQRRGLLREPRRPPGGVRRYGEEDLARLRFIRRAQELGFTLREIAELLALDDGTGCARARRVAEARLADVRRRIRSLRRMERALAGLVQACETAGGRGRVACPLITSLQREASAGP